MKLLFQLCLRLHVRVEAHKREAVRDVRLHYSSTFNVKHFRFQWGDLRWKTHYAEAADETDEGYLCKWGEMKMSLALRQPS